jgi:hypothetical protein
MPARVITSESRRVAPTRDDPSGASRRPIGMDQSTARPAPPGERLAILIFAVFVLLTGAVAFFTYDDVRVAKQWAAGQNEAPARVIEVFEGEPNGPYPYLVVEFTAEGRTVQAKIKGADWNGGDPRAWPDRGDTVQIVYDPAAPSETAKDAGRGYAEIAWNSAVPAAFALVSLCVAIILRVRRR